MFRTFLSLEIALWMNVSSSMKAKLILNLIKVLQILIAYYCVFL